MTFTVHIVFQAIAMVIQLGNFAVGVVPEKYKWIVTGVVGMAQAGMAFKAHWVNPDGTPAEAAHKAQQ